MRRCALEFDQGGAVTGFTVNINVLGAYVAIDDQPRLGQAVTCRFRAPGKDMQVTLRGTVTWLNPGQQHPVHSLPPGFGLKLQPLSDADRRFIEDVVEDYTRRNPQALK